jgi:hypothetical protein
MWFHPESFDKEYAWNVLHFINSRMRYPDLLVRNEEFQKAINQMRAAAQAVSV